MSLITGGDGLNERWSSMRAESRWEEDEAVNDDPLAVALEIFAEDSNTERVGSFSESFSSASPPVVANTNPASKLGSFGEMAFSSAGPLSVT